MKLDNKRQAAKKFKEFWLLAKDSETGGYSKFWLSLLSDVLGADDVFSRIDFQSPVPMNGTTKYLDAWIPETRVLIEHKSRGIRLDAPQAGHGGKTPFEQALEYNIARPYSEKARWIVTCNFAEIWVYDMDKPLAAPQKIRLGDLPKEVARLEFLVDSSVKSIREKEKEISIQAGRIVGELYKELLKRYADPGSSETLKALNRLCVRLVFLFYAEDAELFPKDAFWNFLKETPAKFLRGQLIKLFHVLDTPGTARDPYLEPELCAFPYTNGGLFKFCQCENVANTQIQHQLEIGNIGTGNTSTLTHSPNDIPPLDDEIKELLIRSSNFDWREISPTIFGALFESTLNPVTRRAGGMVYTSVENIHKVIDPLFLSDLTRRVNECVALPPSPSRNRRLLALQDEMASLTFLDPACGSGNFLTETYICLRRLENRIIAALQQGQSELDLGISVKVSIVQFHGIEINDFAVAVAKTALWIAEAQMLQETAQILHREPDFLPLKDYDGIVEGNALRMDWGKIGLPNSMEKNDARGITDSISKRQGLDPSTADRIQHCVETVNLAVARNYFSYIIGNPPFVGGKLMDASQKEDMLAIFGKKWKNLGNMDYVSCWYKKAIDFMRGTDMRAALVSTNSLTQGQAVASLLGPLMSDGLEIDFAWRTFIWDSESVEKAHVHCVIIGFHIKGSPELRTQQKTIFDNDTAISATNINGYLMDAPNIVIDNRTQPICDVPLMDFGNMPNDGGNLLLAPEEHDAVLKSEPRLATVIRPFVGATEFINGKKRYCFWLKDASPEFMRSSPILRKRIEAVRSLRLASTAAPTREKARIPHLFFYISHPDTTYLLVPSASSENRRYIPIGFMDRMTIASNLVLIVPDATIYHFGVLTSSVHMAWVRAIGGRLKSDYRYSNKVVYNNFPWPTIRDATTAVENVSKTAQTILDARAQHPESSYSTLYDDTFMPADLRAAHEANDCAVLAAYGLAPDTPEPEIVAHLFGLYAKMMKKEVTS